MSRSLSSSTSGFLNVDLDISSRANLEVLATAFAPRAFSLTSEWIRRGTWFLRLELNSPKRRPETVILAFCDLVEKLPSAARRLWDRARYKCFNVGWNSPGEGVRYTGFALKTATLARIAGLGATLEVTLYPHFDPFPDDPISSAE